MTRQNFDIDRLRVAAPCPVSWDAMKGDDRRRFCDLCQFNVYNLSEMTADEVRRLVSESEGRICGRLYKRADGTVLTKDCPVGLRAYRKRVARLAGAALTAVLGLFSVSYGQQTDEKTAPDSNIKIVRTTHCESIFSGTIADSEGAAVGGAVINLYKNNLLQRTLRAGEDGGFSVSGLAAGAYAFEIHAPGFKKFKMTEVLIGDFEQVDFNIKLEVGEVMIGIIVDSDALVETDPDTRIQTGITPRKPENER